MQKQVVLKPVRGGQKIWFTGIINNRTGGQTVITQDFLIKRKEELSPNESPLEVKFNNTLTAFIISWDSKYEEWPIKDELGRLTGEYDYRKKKAADELCRHHQVKPLYGIANPNLKGVPLFEIEDLSVRNQYGSSRIINQFKVVQKILGMSFQEKTDCAFYYGYSGQSKNHSDIFIYLADFKFGVLHDDIIREQNQLSVIEDFLTKYNTSGKEVEVKVVVEKALTQGLFKKLDSGYFYNDQYIGSKKEHLIDYCNGREEIYDFLKSQVANARLGEDDLKQVLESIKKESTMTMPDSELLIKETKSEELIVRDMAKKKHIRTWGITGVEKLKGMFDEADKLIKMAEERKINIEKMWIDDIKVAIEAHDRKLPVKEAVTQSL